MDIRISAQAASIAEGLSGAPGAPDLERKTMDRRAFLKNSAALAASTALPVSPSGAFAGSGQSALPQGQPAHDGYIPPSWLQYSRTIYFEGYTEPVFPYMQYFDAERLV